MSTHLRVYVPLENSQNNSEPSENAQRAINLFQGEAPSDLKVTVRSFIPKKSSDYDQDFMIVREALQNCTEEDENCYVIICKDTSISSASSSTILSVVNQVIKKDKEINTSFDLYYMAKWFDNCHLYTNKCELEGRGIFLADTVDARGIQCLMFSPRGMNKFLKLNPTKKGHQLSNVLRNRLVHRTNLTEYSVKESQINFVAITTYPTQVQFDIRYARNDSDYAKTQVCSPLTGPERPVRSSSNISFFIFVAISAVIAFGIYYLVKHGLAMTKNSHKNLSPDFSAALAT